MGGRDGEGRGVKGGMGVRKKESDRKTEEKLNERSEVTKKLYAHF